MCYPLLIMAAVTAASAIAQKRQQDVAYSRQSQSLKTQAGEQQEALTRQAEQQRVADTQQANDAAKQSLHDMSLFDTVAGEFGGGVTDHRAAAVQSVQRGERLATIEENGQTAQSELGFQGIDAHAQALARLGTLTPGSNLALGLKVGGAVASAYSGGAGGPS
jgi:hypothetical protein